MVRITREEGDKRLVCEIDMKSGKTDCELEKNVGEYGFSPVAKGSFDISEILKGKNTIRQISKGEGDAKDLVELQDMVSYNIPWYVRVEKNAKR